MKILKLLVYVVLLVFCFCRKSDNHYTQPVPKHSGFKMNGWFVWGGSAIKVDDVYHLFASRWPDSTGFPSGYMQHSEIVRATSTNPLGPYNFQEIVIGEREPEYWDSEMAHNPSIYKTGNTYVLYYNAISKSGGYRQVGYATTQNVEGPWKRCEEAIDFGMDANNPAAFFESDGSVKLMWRDRNLRTYLATAPSFVGPYTIQNDNVWSESKIEDFYLFKQNGQYYMVCEDNAGAVSGHVRWGVRFVSNNGIYNWQPVESPIFYDHTICWTDGSVLQCERRERPQLLIDENGNVTHLFTSVLFEGKTWNQVVPLRFCAWK